MKFTIAIIFIIFACLRWFVFNNNPEVVRIIHGVAITIIMFVQAVLLLTHDGDKFRDEYDARRDE